MLRPIYIILISLGFIVLNQAVWASVEDKRLEEGIKSYKLKNYQKAYDFLMPLAQQGIAEAQSIIGSMYRVGTPFTNKSATEAFAWQVRAAMQCNPRGLTNVGGHFRTGNGVYKSEKDAILFYSMAAKLGYEPAIYNYKSMKKDGFSSVSPNTSCLPFSFAIAQYEPSDFSAKFCDGVYCTKEERRAAIKQHNLLLVKKASE